MANNIRANNMPDPNNTFPVSFWHGETYYTVTGKLDDQAWWTEYTITADGDISELLDSGDKARDVKSHLLELAMVELTKKDGE